jgi:hypothetical protein
MNKTMKLIKLDLKAGISPMIWGPPGVGKSAAVKHLAKTLGWNCITVIPAIYDPADFSGVVVSYPVIREGNIVGVEVTRKPGAPFIRQILESERPCLLFFDEITCAPPLIQAAILRIILEKVVGDVELPESTGIIAAGNPVEFSAGGSIMSPPLANRFSHYEWDNDPMDFALNFPSYWGSPPDCPELGSERWAFSRSLIASFIRLRPELLHKIPEDESKLERAWPSNRTWDFASRKLSLLINPEDPSRVPDLTVEVISSCVGEGASLEFVSWLINLDLPSPEEILKNPEKLPERQDRLYAVLSSVVAIATEEEEKWLKAWKVLAKAATNMGAIDVAAPFAGILARARKSSWRIPEEIKLFADVVRKL